jgi:hypothetical protein
LWYWNRTSLFVGLGFHDNPVVVGYGALGYQLDQLRMPNTTIFTGITTRKNPIVGLRWAF